MIGVHVKRKCAVPVKTSATVIYNLRMNEQGISHDSNHQVLITDAQWRIAFRECLAQRSPARCSGATIFRPASNLRCAQVQTLPDTIDNTVLRRAWLSEPAEAIVRRRQNRNGLQWMQDHTSMIPKSSSAPRPICSCAMPKWVQCRPDQDGRCRTPSLKRHNADG